jgi:hypothetical protein
LSDWVGNIDSLYKKLPEDVREAVKGEYRFVLTKILDYGEKALELEIKRSLDRMVSELS